MFRGFVDTFLDPLGSISRRSKACVPDVAEHRLGKLEQPFGGLQRLQKVFEVAFELVTLD